jgi:Flp pilus assembly protein TadB
MKWKLGRLGEFGADVVSSTQEEPHQVQAVIPFSTQFYNISTRFLSMDQLKKQKGTRYSHPRMILVSSVCVVVPIRSFVSGTKVVYILQSDWDILE